MTGLGATLAAFGWRATVIGSSGFYLRVEVLPFGETQPHSTYVDTAVWERCAARSNTLPPALWNGRDAPATRRAAVRVAAAHADRRSR